MHPTRSTVFLIFACVAVFIACADDESPTEDVEAFEIVACRGPFDCHLPNPQGSHRYRNLASDDGRWRLRPGTHLRDGLGNDRGAVTDGSALVNYGQRKMLLDAPHVYAWNVALADGTHASGWIREGAFVESLRGMPTIHARNPGQGDGPEYVVVGGDAASYPHRDLKFDDRYAGPNREPGDYLTRPGGVVNLLYNLPFPGIGGVPTDTLPVGVRFVRSAGVDAVHVPLYPRGGAIAVASMAFIYGRIGVRYGWLALDALSRVTGATPPAPVSPPTPAPPPSTPRCCALCRFRVAYHDVDVAHDCTVHARTYCSVGSRGGLIDAQWGACD